MKLIIFLTAIVWYLIPQPVHAQETTTRLYIPTSNQTTILKENGEQKMLVKDYLNSTREVESNSSANRKEYFPYGDEQSTDQLSTDRQFTGHRKLNETGIYHAGARFYSPQLGAFIQADKVEGPNRYAYVQGNPIKYIDSSGNSCETSPLNFPDIGCNDYQVPEAIKEDLPPEYWNRLRDATVQVKNWKNLPNNEYEQQWGGAPASGVSVGPGEIVTNRHVAIGYDYTQNVGHPMAKIGSKNKAFLYARPSWIDDSYDIATLKYDFKAYGGGFGTVPVAKQMPETGDAIFGLGYDGYVLNLEGKQELHHFRGRVMGYDKTGVMLIAGGGHIDNHRESIPFTFGGSSGSGLVNANGELVAIRYANLDPFRGMVQLKLSPEELATTHRIVRDVSVEYGFNPSYVENISYAVPMSKYMDRR